MSQNVFGEEVMRTMLQQEEETLQPRSRGRDLTWYAFLFLAPAVILLGMELVDRGNGARVLQWVGQEPAAALLSYAFLLGAVALLTALTGQQWIGIIVPGLPALTLAVTNYVKMSVNGTDLVLSDIAMVSNMGTLMAFMPPDLRLSAGATAGIVLAGAFAAGSGFFAGGLPAYWRSWRRRGVAMAAAVGVMALAALAPMAYFAGDPEASQAERDHKLGLLGGLYSGLLNRGLEPPQGYDPAEVQGLLASLETGAPEGGDAVRPNVVMLMSESFCDPAVVLPGVAFDTDPAANFHALSAQCPSGQFLSNCYAGGTGNVEMEVFTGVPSGFLPEEEDLTTISAEGAYQRAPSIVKAFARAGYHTQFIHSYGPQLYNREENLPAIGFQELTFAEDFPADAPTAGPYLSDSALSREMIRAFEEKEAGEPLFLFGLSMGNHQPIFAGKYDQPSGLGTSAPGLSPQDLGTVDALAQGLQGADQGLGELVDYLKDYDEPVIFVFWGDHLPGLYVTTEHSIFSALGYVPTANMLQWSPQVMKQMYATSFFVWNNYGAELEVPREVSATSLGTLTLGWAGVEKPSYFNWVDKALDTMLLYRGRLYVDSGGAPSTRIPQEDRAVMDTYGKIVYYLLYDGGSLPEFP